MSLLTFAKKIAGREQNNNKKKAQTRRAADVSATTPAAPVVMGDTAGMLPLITEKSVATHADTNTVVFRVGLSTTKGQIRQAVKERYKIEPIAVRTLSVTPKVRRRGRSEGQTVAWKKAYVTLPEGASIDVAV